MQEYSLEHSTDNILVTGDTNARTGILPDFEVLEIPNIDFDEPEIVNLMRANKDKIINSRCLNA